MNKALKELIKKALIKFNDPNEIFWKHYIGKSKWCKCLMMEATYLMHEKYKIIDNLLERMAEVFLNEKLDSEAVGDQQEQIVELFEEIPMKIERSTLSNE